MTGNLESEHTNDGRVASSKWRPYGRIRVEEIVGRNLGNQPLRYCKVRVNKLLKFASANTSVSNGTFSITTDFKGEVNYNLAFETAGESFKVCNALGFSIDHNGPKISGPWNFDISFNANDESWMCATILNAVYHFRVQASAHNLKLPGLETVKIRPKFKEGRSHVVNSVFTHGFLEDALLIDAFVMNDVKIFQFNINGRLDTDDLYAVVMHELGHMSHVLSSPNNFVLCDGITRESWAQAIEYYFTLPYYPDIVSDDLIGSPTFIEGIPDQSLQNIEFRGWRYTPFFVDLRDNINQRTNHNGSTDFANDAVSGYTLNQMQNALNNRTRLDGVCTYLRNNYNNATENNLDNLLEFYENIKERNK